VILLLDTQPPRILTSEYHKVTVTRGKAQLLLPCV
jgi:hypothetical protein